MAFWTTVLPYAGMAAGYMAGGPLGMAAGGALGGAMAGESKRREALQRQEQTANAAAEAGRVSWARRGGPGQIPGIQWASEGEREAPMAGAFGAGLQGYMLGRGIQNSSAPASSSYVDSNYSMPEQGAAAGPKQYGLGMDWVGSGYKADVPSLYSSSPFVSQGGASYSMPTFGSRRF